jgi:hypothetical protein
VSGQHYRTVHLSDLVVAWTCQSTCQESSLSALVRIRGIDIFVISDFPLANNLDTIPAPLLDRMEVLEVSGYVSEEKAVIADKYLGPQAKDSSGLKNADVTVDAGAIDALIKYYCRESGVRNLKKHIEKVNFASYVTASYGRLNVTFLDLPKSRFEDCARPWRGNFPRGEGRGQTGRSRHRRNRRGTGFEYLDCNIDKGR